jgi:alpha-mannosidase
VLSILNITPSDLIITAFKQAEDNEGIIIRFFNIKHKQVKGLISFYKKIKKCFLTNLSEEIVEELELNNEKISIEVPQFKIITLKLIL